MISSPQNNQLIIGICLKFILAQSFIGECQVLCDFTLSNFIEAEDCIVPNVKSNYLLSVSNLIIGENYEILMLVNYGIMIDTSKHYFTADSEHKTISTTKNFIRLVNEKADNDLLSVTVFIIMNNIEEKKLGRYEYIICNNQSNREFNKRLNITTGVTLFQISNKNLGANMDMRVEIGNEIFDIPIHLIINGVYNRFYGVDEEFYVRPTFSIDAARYRHTLTEKLLEDFEQTAGHDLTAFLTQSGFSAEAIENIRAKSDIIEQYDQRSEDIARLRSNYRLAFYEDRADQVLELVDKYNFGCVSTLKDSIDQLSMNEQKVVNQFFAMEKNLRDVVAMVDSLNDENELSGNRDKLEFELRNQLKNEYIDCVSCLSQYSGGYLKGLIASRVESFNLGISYPTIGYYVLNSQQIVGLQASILLCRRLQLNLAGGILGQNHTSIIGAFSSDDTMDWAFSRRNGNKGIKRNLYTVEMEYQLTDVLTMQHVILVGAGTDRTYNFIGPFLGIHDNEVARNNFVTGHSISYQDKNHAIATRFGLNQSVMAPHGINIYRLMFQEHYSGQKSLADLETSTGASTSNGKLFYFEYSKAFGKNRLIRFKGNDVRTKGDYVSGGLPYNVKRFRELQHSLEVRVWRDLDFNLGVRYDPLPILSTAGLNEIIQDGFYSVNSGMRFSGNRIPSFQVFGGPVVSKNKLDLSNKMQFRSFVFSAMIFQQFRLKRLGYFGFQAMHNYLEHHDSHDAQYSTSTKTNHISGSLDYNFYQKISLRSSLSSQYIKKNVDEESTNEHLLSWNSELTVRVKNFRFNTGFIYSRYNLSHKYNNSLIENHLYAGIRINFRQRFSLNLNCNIALTNNIQDVLSVPGSYFRTPLGQVLITYTPNIK